MPDLDGSLEEYRAYFGEEGFPYTVEDYWSDQGYVADKLSEYAGWGE